MNKVSVQLSVEKRIVKMSEMTYNQIGTLVNSGSRYDGELVIGCDGEDSEVYKVLMLKKNDGWSGYRKDKNTLKVALLPPGTVITIEIGDNYSD